MATPQSLIKYGVPKITKAEAVILVGTEEVARMEKMEREFYQGSEALVLPEGCKVFPRRQGCVIHWFMKGYTPGDGDVKKALARIRK
jgi:hypothetical protein